jgi:hypothetical protein
MVLLEFELACVGLSRIFKNHSSAPSVIDLGCLPKTIANKKGLIGLCEKY